MAQASSDTVRVGVTDQILEREGFSRQTGLSLPDLITLLIGIVLLIIFMTTPWLTFSSDLRDAPTKSPGHIISNLPNDTTVSVVGTAFLDRLLWLQVEHGDQTGWIRDVAANDTVGGCDNVPTYEQDEISGSLILDEGGRNRLSSDGEGVCHTTTIFDQRSLTAWEALNITSQSLLFIFFAALIAILAGSIGLIFPGSRINTALATTVAGVMSLWYFSVFFREDWARRSEEVVAAFPAGDYIASGFWITHILVFGLLIQIALPRPGLALSPYPLVNLRIYLGKVWRNMRQNPVLYWMLLPGVIYFAVFQYGPMYGATIAFKEYRVLEGILGSPWMGFQHFETIFTSTYFTQILGNTIIISMLKFLVGVPAAVTLAILMNEVRTQWFKRTVQTVTYMPHFLSWVVISGIAIAMLGQADGLINNTITDLGGGTVNFLGSPDWFRQVLVGTDLWKSMGFEAIIYLAAIAGISPELYEAAAVDGASRFRRILHITLPGILPVVVLVALLNIGYVLSAGFEQVFVLYSIPVYSVGDIIDTWVYRRGLEQFQFDVAAAMGLFKGLVGMVLVLSMNWLARRLTGSGIW